MKELKLRIFKNTSWLILGEAISRFLVAILIIFAARILGPTQFGIFSFAIAFCSIFLIFSNFGLNIVTTRELAKNKENEQDYPGVLSLKIVLSIIAFLFIIFVSLFTISDETIRGVVWILAGYVLIHNFFVFVYSFFRAREQMKYEAGIRILEAFLITLIGFFVLSQIPSVKNLSYAFLIAVLVMLVFVTILLLKTIRPIRSFWNLNIWKKFLKLSWPLALAYSFSMICIYLDSTMMGFWGQIVEVGWYNAAYRIVGILMIPATLIGTSFLPVLSKLFSQSKKDFQKVVSSLVRLMIVLAILIVIVGILLSSYIINLLYGQAFSPAVLALQILIVMAGLSYIYTSLYIVLISVNQQKKIFWITFVGALVNIILNFILIPRYSLYGAASATLITYIVLVVLGFYYFIKYENDNKKHNF